MFCKTKKKSAETFSLASEERRRAFRVTPCESAPIELVVRGKTARIRDISAGGFSLEGSDLARGDRESVSFSLPGLDTGINAAIEVISVGAGQLAHCRFIDLTDGQQDAIHLYALERQKALIRSAKEMKGTPTP